MKALEDLSVHYDHTVRNASNAIMQFSYGDDSLDPVLMEGKEATPLDLPRTLKLIKATTKVPTDRYVPRCTYIYIVALYSIGMFSSSNTPLKCISSTVILCKSNSILLIYRFCHYYYSKIVK